MYGNIDREVPAIQYPAFSLSLSLPSFFSVSLSLSLSRARIMRWQRKKKRYVRRRRDEEGERIGAQPHDDYPRQQERDNREGRARPVPTRFFPSSVLLSDVIELRGKLCRERGSPRQSEGRKREREKKEGTSLAPLEKHRGE